MSFWMREATLQIGGKVYGMDDLYFEFEVPLRTATPSKAPPSRLITCRRLPGRVSSGGAPSS